MKRKYIGVALLVLFLVYLANSNPSKGDYTEWAAKQFMKRNDVNEKLTAIEKEDPDGLVGELATIGKKLAKKYVKPQVGLLIDHYTERSDYIFFSTYTTELTIGEKNYKYVSVGLSHIFIPIEMPKKEEGTAK
ncbi:DUF4359 domain-containing protein [Bacillus sp. DX4.1]|uniref:DUF4359 domain-containing protein n=1 Tax=Bacillus sp. DX4.1 TaxID=3055867 RepID=UPI0025A0C3C3|nr:DUF4359 domain-containing protein [Bacillus sp. DX4.1]MDM5190824.1 DUF4359 domain-containing protein [Bacillus sp. DX4.1]